MKSRTSLFVIGIFITILAASILTVLALFLAGAIVTEKPELEFTVNAVAAKEYDGTPLKASKFYWESGEKELKDGHRVEGTFLGSQTDAGTSESDLRVTVYDANNRDVTDEYSIKVNNCELTVLQKEIFILLQPQEIPYSGKEIFIEKYEIFDGSNIPESLDGEGNGALVAGHRLAISYPGQFENVGDAFPLEYTRDNVRIYNAEGNLVTRNYKFSMQVKGSIEIVPRRIKVKVVDTEKDYDGTPITGRCELISGSFIDGEFIGGAEFVDEYQEDGSLTKVGQKRVKVSKVYIYRQEGYDLVRVGEATDKAGNNYILEGGAEIFGTLKINRRPVTVTLKSFEKIYNGQSLSSSLGRGELPYTTDMPERFTLGGVTFDFTDVYDGPYTFDNLRIIDENADTDEESDVTDQFEINQKAGNIKIKPIAIPLSLNSLDPQLYSGEIIEIPLSVALTDDDLKRSINAYINSGVSTFTNAVRNALQNLEIGDVRAACAESVQNADKYFYGVELTEDAAAKFGKAGNVIFDATAEFEIKKVELELYYNGTEGAKNSVVRPYDGKEAAAGLRYQNLVLNSESWAQKCAVSSADFIYGENYDNCVICGEYTVTVNNVHIIDRITAEDVTQNFILKPVKENTEAPHADGEESSTDDKKPSADDRVTPVTLNVEITQRPLYISVGQSVIYGYEADPLDIDVDAIADQYQSSVRFDGLAEGDVVDSYVMTGDISGNTIVISVSVSTVMNSDGENVIDCYSLGNLDVITIYIKETA